MSGEVLPVDGPALIADVRLPVGHRIYGNDYDRYDDRGSPERSDIPFAWVTTRRIADAGETFLALSAAHARTGLIPVLLSSSDRTDEDSGEANFCLDGAEDVSLIDSISTEEVLAAQWDFGDEDEFDAYWAQHRDPFGATFPGLAPAESTALPMPRLLTAAVRENPAFLALVAVRRPADVPAAVGWSAFGVDQPGSPEARSLEISAVLRSWETRFGARPLRIGGDSIMRVLVERPPSTLEAAIPVAAEHMAFADECGERSGYPVRELAARLVGNPVWHFWWD